MTRQTVIPKIIETLRGFDSPTISNAIEGLDIRDATEGYASLELRCQFPNLGPMVGYAVTCTADSTTPGEQGQSRLLDVFDAVAAAPKPAVVVIQNVGHDRLRSCFVGDIAAAAYSKLGATGVVTDGGFRDGSGIRRQAPEFQVFAPGAVVSHGSVRIIDVSVPVEICGLRIAPGDLLHGDESGLCSVPLDAVEAILEQAKMVQTLESDMIDAVQRPGVVLDEIKRRFEG